MATVTPELVKLAAQAKSAHLALCRKDINAFVEYVIKDDETQKPVKQGVIQRKLHALADKHRRVAIMSMPESGKTKNLVVARTLFELGNNPNLRFGIVCQSAEKAQKSLKSIAEHIKNSKELHEVFPDLKPDYSAPWTNKQLTVIRTSDAADPSIQAFGSLSDITGARIDRLIVDDLLTGKNTITKHQRDAVYNFFFGTLPSRMTRDARIIILSNAWHPDDLVHRLEANQKAGNSSWHVERIPVLDDNGDPVWPEQWPLSRIEEKRLEVGPLQFAREMLCQARSDSDARFRSDYLVRACMNGRGLNTASSWEEIEAPKEDCGIEIDDWTLRTELKHYMQTGVWRVPLHIYTGVDLAFAVHSAADETAIVTVLVYPNGLRQILHVTAGRWTFPEVCDKLEAIYEALRPEKIMIESNAAQTVVAQHLTRTTDLPIVPYTTGKAKADPTMGVEAIAGAMALGRWAIPSTDGSIRGILDHQVSRLVEECLYYTPEKHTGDRLMALWFADTCARMFLGSRGKVSVLNFSAANKGPKAGASTVQVKTGKKDDNGDDIFESVDRVKHQREAARKMRDDLRKETRLMNTRPWLWHAS